MINSKWSIYQGLALLLLLGSILLAEYIADIRNAFLPFLFAAIILGCFYLLFLFEAKKGNNFFNHTLWNKIPFIIICVGIFSLFIFMSTAFFGPLFQWTEQWRFLIYLFLSYFLFLLFVFVFSLVYKNRAKGERDEKTVHLTYLWSLGVLFVSLFFIQPI